jgi:hypothetical protein
LCRVPIYRARQAARNVSRPRDFEEVFSIMKAVKTHVGRCDTCGEPAAYAQLLPGGRTFRFCEQHVPLLVKKQAEAAATANKDKK